MDNYGLVLNAGSLSRKFCVYRRPDVADRRLAARGQIDGIGSAPKLSARDDAGSSLVDKALDDDVRDGRAALDVLAGWLRESFGGAKVLGVGHRVVHGGARHAKPCLITPEVLEELRALAPLAPLHQPHNLGAIDAVAEGRVIVAHLGSGASLCAMKARRSVDSTLGFTALDGLCMGTRPGAVDPGVILHLLQTMGLSAAEMEKLLYKKFGLLGISGLSNDMRDLADNPDPRARLAVDYFVYQAAKQIGALAAALGGVDALVFTVGIGENSAFIRRRICEASAWLGLELDGAANDSHGPRIPRTGSPVSAWVIPTNEELMIARHTGAVRGIAGRRA